jgi:hypothetical protein
MARMGRISVRVENKLKKRIKRFAEREDVTTADFCRRLFQWAAEEYERIGDLVAMRRISLEREKPARKAGATR